MTKQQTRPARTAGESLAEKAYARIESLIVTLKLPPGTMISEVELGAQLGMSRTPVGEALLRLDREGLVTIKARRGILVTEISVASQLRLLEVRREISRLVARAGATRAWPEQRDALRTLADEFMAAAHAQDEAALMRADKAFHALFAQCARNEHAARALEAMESQARRFAYAYRLHARDLFGTAKLHADIARAVADGQVELAAQASDVLADCLEAMTRATLDSGDHRSS